MYVVFLATSSCLCLFHAFSFSSFISLCPLPSFFFKLIFPIPDFSCLCLFNLAHIHRLLLCFYIQIFLSSCLLSLFSTLTIRLICLSRILILYSLSFPFQSCLVSSYFNSCAFSPLVPCCTSSQPTVFLNSYLFRSIYSPCLFLLSLSL